MMTDRERAREILRSALWGDVNAGDDWQMEDVSVNELLPAIATALAQARAEGLRQAAEVAETWEPLPRLLPLCTPGENEAALVGQHEAGERIAAAIRALAEGGE